MKPWHRRAALPCALLAWHSAVPACGEGLGAGTSRIESPQFELVYRPVPSPVAVGRFFSLDFALCPRGAAPPPAQVRVDAHMPEHKHGMNYQSAVSARGAGLYRAEGLLFHMPGRWELVFEWRGGHGSALQRLAQSLQIE